MSRRHLKLSFITNSDWRKNGSIEAPLTTGSTFGRVLHHFPSVGFRQWVCEHVNATVGHPNPAARKNEGLAEIDDENATIPFVIVIVIIRVI